MAKIKFLIQDNANNAVSSASLVMRCRFKNGEQWKSEQLTGNEEGVIWLEIDNRLVKRIRWESLALDIQRQGKKLDYTHSSPDKTKPGTYLISIKISDIPETRDKEDVTDESVSGGSDTSAGTKTDKYTVSGVVATHDGTPSPSVFVTIFDRDVGVEKQLGKTFTDKQGKYAVPYFAKDLSTAQKSRADLIVRVYKDEKNKQLIVESPLIANADINEHINLVADERRYRGKSLYDRLDEALRGKLEGLDPSKLGQTDIWLLSNQKNLPFNKVNLYVIARKFAKNSVLPAQVFFGLFVNRGESLACL
jgi:hypothetical protein